MTAWALRAGLAAIVAATLVVRWFVVDVRGRDVKVKPVVIGLLQSYGLSYRDDPDADGQLKPLAFDAPGCAKPLLVRLLDVTFQEQALLDPAGASAAAHRYFYLDRSWPERDRAGVFITRVKNMLLAMVGQSPYVANTTVIMTSEADGCRAVETIDWRKAWDRDYLSALQAHDPR